MYVSKKGLPGTYRTLESVMGYLRGLGLQNINLHGKAVLMCRKVSAPSSKVISLPAVAVSETTWNQGLNGQHPRWLLLKRE